MAATNKVTRITAKDDAPKSAQKVDTKVQKTEKVKKQPKVTSQESKKNIFARIWAYFKGAWVELRLVRWPNRSATWGLTLAVILFSAFFVLLVVLLDMLFKYIFELIIT